MIKFTAQTIQVYKADISDHERKLKQMARTEKAQTLDAGVSGYSSV